MLRLAPLLAVGLLFPGIAHAQNPEKLREAQRFLHEERFDAALRSYQVLRAGESGLERDALSMDVVGILVALGRIGRAELELRRLTDRKLPYPPALIEQARLSLELLPERPGTLETAERAVRRSRAARPRDARAAVQWAGLASARGRYSEAIRRFQDVLDSLDPGNPAAARGLARVHLEVGEFDEAQAVMQACLAVHPRDAESHWFAGNVAFARRGTPPEGTAADPQAGLRRLRERTLSSFQSAMAYAPETSRYQGSVMLVHYLDQSPEVAEPVLGLLEVEAPYGSYTWLGRGMRSELKGDVDGARSAYELALEADDRNRWAHFFLGGIEAGRGNPELLGSSFDAAKYPARDPGKGRKHLRRALRGAPEFPFRKAAKDALRAIESVGYDDQP